MSASSGKWNPNSNLLKPMRAPKGLSVDAPEFVPKSVQQQQVPLPAQSAAYIGQDLHHQQHPEGQLYGKGQQFYPGSGAIVDNNAGKRSVQNRLTNNQMAMNENFNNHNQHPMPMHPNDGSNAYNHNLNNHPLNSLSSRMQNMRIEQPPIAEPAVEHKPTESETEALSYLSGVISKLCDNPGHFDTCIKKIKDMFTGVKNSHFVMSNAIEMIFEQSINEQNFRYMGARLCSLLDELDMTQESVFRDLLHLKMEYQQTELISLQHDSRKVRGTTMFLAELYIQLRKPHDILRNKNISHWIVESMMLLLSKEGPENVKCVCQALKLCGFELESDLPSAVHEIMLMLSKCNTDFQTQRLVKSVLELHGNSWGREEQSTQPIMNELVQQPLIYNDSPVFYGPDGQILTEEENMFLDTLPNLEYEEFDDEDPDELVDDDDGIDLEIKMAFKDFVQHAKKK